MIKNNFFIKNNIQQKYLNARYLKKSSKEFEKIFLEINSNIEGSKKTLNVLSNKFKFNFQTKDKWR